MDVRRKRHRRCCDLSHHDVRCVLKPLLGLGAARDISAVVLNPQTEPVRRRVRQHPVQTSGQHFIRMDAGAVVDQRRAFVALGVLQAEVGPVRQNIIR